MYIVPIIAKATAGYTRSRGNEYTRSRGNEYIQNDRRIVGRFIFYAFRVMSKESRLFFVPRTSRFFFTVFVFRQ
jgi:hypothetical protein